MIETVFITGADRGLGLALAEKFLAEGYRVFAGSLGGADNLARLAAKFPDHLHVIPQDVTDMASVRRAAEAVARLTDCLDILINNAGINPRHTLALLPELDLADGSLEQVMAVNAFGPLRVTQQLLPLLEKGRRKRILTVTSEAGSIASAATVGSPTACRRRRPTCCARYSSGGWGPRATRCWPFSRVGCGPTWAAHRPTFRPRSRPAASTPWPPRTGRPTILFM